MPKIDESDNRLCLLASSARIVFRWADDRWTHEIELDREDAGPTLVASIEGEADPTRVVSPAFQQIHAQRPADDPEAVQALLVGQSGPHHFSAVFTLREISGATRLSVEVADRCRAAVVALASTYAVDLASSSLRDASPSGICWDLPADLAGSLAIEADAPTRLDLREAGRRGAQVQAAASVEPGRSTFSWSYGWTVRIDPR